ncbi:hypothetical protein F2P56_024087 [Juglans regia]|uniref:Uncharacterized protein LOC108979298 n=2 Tax=Juglans regia TaxID=51240 RepID=A0A2I4DED2_JUGRE|nr:uncharacterized protein LOC108979298 [Juglans regia]KAF5454420.1 hypothetical protein F2P56_024087 [Juglans regia]
MVDAAARGALMSKTHEAAYELLEELASNNYQQHSERVMPRKAFEVFELDSITTLAVQMANLSQKLGNHSSIDCQVENPFAQPSYEQAHYGSNFQRQNNPYSNLFNPGWRNHPNFSWSNNQAPARPSQQFLQQEKEPTLEDMFMQYMQETNMLIQNNSASIRNLETQIEFLKDILSNKQKLEEHETVMLIEKSSAILQKKLLPKLKDPEGFTIPYTIGNSYFDKALCNLGASINLMSLSVFRILGLREAKPTAISLQVVDRSIKFSRGLIEDVMVKVDKFIFLVDFIVLDMEEDEEILLILGQPFLTTGRTLIDVQQGKLILRVGEE